MIPRKIASRLKSISQKVPVVTLIGPRQSGKTTLVRALFPDYTYVNLESIQNREYAQQDPVGFLKQYNRKVILDEIQRSPQLLSEIQVKVDEENRNGDYILTGSQNLLLLEAVSQSLAGRTIICKLLPFSLEELEAANSNNANLFATMLSGFYPRLIDQNLSASEWLPSYVETYIERDIRQLKNVHDLTRFQTLLKLCAGRTGQLINYASLGNDCGISEKTVKSWISILETTFILFRLQPHYENFSKRLIKTPKIYFYDTGLLCYLLGIKTEQDIQQHYLRGGIFENLVIAELYKRSYARETERNFYFWRDRSGLEVDCLTETAGKFHIMEIKSAGTINNDFFKGLNTFENIAHGRVLTKSLFYGGTTSQQRTGTSVLPWAFLCEGKMPWEM